MKETNLTNIMMLFNFIKREYNFNKGKSNLMKIVKCKKVLNKFYIIGDILVAQGQI